MAYSNDVVRRARQRLESARADHESQALQRLQTAYAELPRIKEIDNLLRRSMAMAAQAVFAQGGDAKAVFEQVKNNNLALQEERKQLIDSRFGPGYLDERPLCPKCGGSGYIGTTMCTCLQDLCRQEQERELSLLASPDQRFDAFRLDYYPDQIDRKYGASPRLIMERTFGVCKRFADEFGAGSGNLLFVGGTGLGKTFLSACIARAVAEKGFSVGYESAQHLFSKMEKDRFNADEASHEAVAKLMDSDLLIIDDLGTELPGNFVTAALYTVINDRLLARKPMVISTNLLAEDIAQRYSPQISSRLQGSFQRLTFVGQDIRVLKNRGF